MKPYDVHQLLILLGNFQSSNHSPSDVYWGQLGGCLECLDAGTTTVVDHAHMNYSPEHSISRPLKIYETPC
jgi:cytosine/adenosine deaminase-related metal-dependent hydrolase